MAHVAGFLTATAAQHGSCPLFFCQGRTTTAGQAAARVASLATALQHRLGIQAGERVCLAALATDHSLEALLAIAACGAIAAPLNWRWTGAEAAYAVQLVDAAAVVADAACIELALQLAARCPSMRAVILLGPVQDYTACASLLNTRQPGLTALFAECLLNECPTAGAGMLPLLTAPGNAALVVFTSGTTGRPKGVVLSHTALHSQCMAKLLVCGYSRADVYLHAAPLFHIGGLNSALAMLLAGAQHVFLPRFDPGTALGLIQQHRVTSFIAVPAMVADLVAAAAAPPAAAGGGGAAGSTAGQATVSPQPCVRRILLGGGGTPPALLRSLAALFPAAVVQSAYGMTEAASSITFDTVLVPQAGAVAAAVGPCLAARCTALDGAQAGEHAATPGCSRNTSSSGASASSPGADAAAGVYVGTPPPGIELAVLQPAAGSSSAEQDHAAAAAATLGASPRGRIAQQGGGEVLTRGPHVLLGYWEDEQATAAVMLPGGWMRTGDLGYLSQGKLWLLGRAKDMIKSGGENVHAWEVERALLSHPAVATAAVVGVSDWRLGEAVAAAVVLHPGCAWLGPHCQSLLSQTQQQQQQQRQLTALSAVRSAVGNSSEGADAAAVQPAGADSNRAQMCADDLGCTLRQEQPHSRPGSALSAHEGAAGLLSALPPRATTSMPKQLWQQQQQRMLQQVADGLHALDARRHSNSGGSSSGDSGSQGDHPGSSRAVDGRALQQHCREAGLAGFKLPRVFLLCRAGSAASPPAAAGRGSRQPPVLPLTSTGKVAKHLLRQLLAQEMRQAAASSSGADGKPRPRL